MNSPPRPSTSRLRTVRTENDEPASCGWLWRPPPASSTTAFASLIQIAQELFLLHGFAMAGSMPRASSKIPFVGRTQQEHLWISLTHGFLLCNPCVGHLGSRGGFAECGQHLTEEDEAYFDGVDDYFCEKCAAELTAQWEAEAAAYAEAKCKITKPLPKYEPQYEYRCTHEDYENGNKESYTPNSHFCHRRHECTNYEELIKPLDRDRAWDRILIRSPRQD